MPDSSQSEAAAEGPQSSAGAGSSGSAPSGCSTSQEHHPCASPQVTLLLRVTPLLRLHSGLQRQLGDAVRPDPLHISGPGVLPAVAIWLQCQVCSSQTPRCVMPRAQLAHSWFCNDIPVCATGLPSILLGTERRAWVLLLIHCAPSLLTTAYSTGVACEHVTAPPDLLRADVWAGTQKGRHAQLTRWVSIGLSVSGLRASTTRGP